MPGARRLDVGILSNEFFDGSLGRMGGFGWAAMRAAGCLRAQAQPVFFSGERLGDPAPTTAHGVPIVRPEARWLPTVRTARRRPCDVMLSIDYRPNFSPFLWARPRTPLIVWVRDPRTPQDEARLATLRIPGRENEKPRGVDPIECTELGRIVGWQRRLGRAVRFVSPAPTALRSKIGPAYGLDGEVLEFLPNPITVTETDAVKARSPLVVFLARLDPYKRPWLVVEIGKRLPDVEFVMAGRSHFSGPGAWEPGTLPPNVRLFGHVAEAEKHALLTSAWLLLNTSIHEGLPVSFLEALAHETPIVSSHDPESVVSRFGAVVEQHDGAGLESVALYADAIEQLVTDAPRRGALGAAGREWVSRTHTPEAFVRRFTELCDELGAR